MTPTKPTKRNTPSPPSGVRRSDAPHSGPTPAPGTPSSGLAIALAYWPDRWARATVLAALAIAPFSSDMAADAWATTLDGLEDTIADVLEDAARFP